MITLQTSLNKQECVRRLNQSLYQNSMLTESIIIGDALQFTEPFMFGKLKPNGTFWFQRVSYPIYKPAYKFFGKLLDSTNGTKIEGTFRMYRLGIMEAYLKIVAPLFFFCFVLWMTFLIIVEDTRFLIVLVGGTILAIFQLRAYLIASKATKSIMLDFLCATLEAVADEE